MAAEAAMGPAGWAKAGIEGAAGLVGGLFSLAAEKKKRELAALQAGQDKRLEAEGMASKTIGDQTPFQQLMNSYNFLGRKGM